MEESRSRRPDRDVRGSVLSAPAGSPRLPRRQAGRRLFPLALCWIATLPAAAAGTPSSSLTERVEAFWQAVRAQDPDRAAALVEPDAKTRFRSRTLLPIHSWQLVRVDLAPSGSSALVVVDCVLRHALGRFPTRVTQRWNLRGSDWWLEVVEASPANLNQLLYGSRTDMPRRTTPGP